MFELKFYTDLSTMPKRVETNIDEVEPVIQNALAKVENLVVTDNKDDIIAADADAAKLTKMAGAVKRFRLDHIAMWKEPMEAFEAKCKSAEKRLEEAASTLRTKTGEVKEMWRERKRVKYRDLWATKLAESFEASEDILTCDWQHQFCEHWLDAKTKGTWCNSGVTEDAVASAMDAEIVRMRQLVEAVEANYSGEPPEVKAKARLALLVNFDMADVITAVNAWKAERAKIEAAAKAEREAQAAKAAADAQKAVSTASASAPDKVPTSPVAEPPVASKPQSGAPVEVYRLEIAGTRDALVKLRNFGASLGVTFKKIG